MFAVYFIFNEKLDLLHEQKLGGRFKIPETEKYKREKMKFWTFFYNYSFLFFHVFATIDNMWTTVKAISIITNIFIFIFLIFFLVL